MADKHLFEFVSSGYFAAVDREAAIQAVMQNMGGGDREDAEEDFMREVPDAEEITATSEESWEDEREVPLKNDQGDVYGYSLRATAAEHAQKAAPWGYCFGGEQ